MNSLKPGFTACFFLLFSLIFASCKDEYTERIKQQKEADEVAIKEYIDFNKIQNAQRQASGVYYVPLTAGTGAQVKRGSTITIHYIGRYLNTNKFESTYDSGQPRTLLANTGRNNGLTEGLNEGLLLMKEGEKALIIIPSMLGYGQYTSILAYEVTVLEVK